MDNTVNVIENKTDNSKDIDKSSLNEKQAYVANVNESNTKESQMIKTVPSPKSEVNKQQSISIDISNPNNKTESVLCSKNEMVLSTDMASPKKNIPDEHSSQTVANTAWKTTSETMSKVAPLKTDKVRIDAITKFIIFVKLNQMPKIKDCNIYLLHEIGSCFKRRRKLARAN